MKNLVRFAVAGAHDGRLRDRPGADARAAAQQRQLRPLAVRGRFGSASHRSPKTRASRCRSILPSSSLRQRRHSRHSPASTRISASADVGGSDGLHQRANAAGQTLDWAVLGGQYPATKNGKISAAKKRRAARRSSPASPPRRARTSSSWCSRTSKTANALQQRRHLPGPNGYTAGGSVYTWANGTAGGNVWGASRVRQRRQHDLYGQGPDQTGIALGARPASSACDQRWHGSAPDLRPRRQPHAEQQRCRSRSPAAPARRRYRCPPPSGCSAVACWVSSVLAAVAPRPRLDRLLTV